MILKIKVKGNSIELNSPKGVKLDTLIEIINATVDKLKEI